MFIPFFIFFSGCISLISYKLFLQHYCAFSFTPFVPTFHIGSQYEILFHLSYHLFYKLVIRLFYVSCVSHSLFELLALAQHTIWLLFQHSSQLFSTMYHVSFSSVVSGISLANCQCILLFFHSSVFSLIHLCLNSFLFIVSVYSIVSATFTASINGATEFMTYHPKLFSSILIYLSHNLSIPFLPFPC